MSRIHFHKLTLLVGLVVSVHLCSCAGKDSRSDASVSAIISSMRDRIAGPPLIHHADGSVSREGSSVTPAWRIKVLHATTWVHVKMEEEQELLRIGRGAVKTIVGVVSDPSDNWELRGRLSVVLGQIGDPSVGRSLLKIACEDSDPYIRQCCWTALGLLESHELLASLSSMAWKGPTEKKVILWAKAMSGSESSAAEFLAMIGAILDGEQTEIATELADRPKLWVNDSQKHMDLRAKSTPENEYLHLDLWRAAFLQNPTTLRILVRALGYHDSHVQHMAYTLLTRDVEDGPRFSGTIEFELHTLEIHQAWTKWWNQHNASIRWDPGHKKYRHS